MIKPKTRRKLSNLVIDRGALFRLSIPFFIMALVSIGVVFAIRLKVMIGLESTELHGIENLDAINALHELQGSVTAIGIYGLILLTCVCLGLWVVFSHRIFGPTVPIRRHIQNLRAGDYSSRIHLRNGDEFRDLAEELNQLAEALATKKK